MYVIAELGINHGGDMALAKAMIQAAKDCGANAVKFQLYDSDKLLEPELAKQVRHCDLSREQWQELVDYAKGIPIDISASVFDLERLEWLKATDPPWYKVASRTVIDDKALVQTILALGKTTFASTGKVGCKRLRIFSPKNLKWLYCKSEYPATIVSDDIANWRAQGGAEYDSLIWADDNVMGYSDHTGRIETCLWAIAKGATVIEVHFSLDKSAPGPDQSSSIEPDDLRTLCKLATELERLASL